MTGTRRRHRSRRTKSIRWMVLAIILCSGMSCLAPVLYASTDCSRWLAEYKQGVLQRRAARRLRAAKYRLTAMVHKPAPPHKYPMRHRLGPLESLHQFQIDCGDLEEPTPAPPMRAALVPPVPLAPEVALLTVPELPPELPPPTTPDLTPDVPTLINVPVTPVETVSAPGETPEPGSLLLVLTGVAAGAEVMRRKVKAKQMELPAA